MDTTKFFALFTDLTHVEFDSLENASKKNPMYVVEEGMIKSKIFNITNFT